MLTRLATALIRRAEARIGVRLDYVHHIARTDLRLLARYNKIFGVLDPNTKVPPLAYHAARIRGALAADCGTCVEAELNLARNANLSSEQIDAILRGDTDALPVDIAAIVTLADATTRDRTDDPDARARVVECYGDAGLIELALAMNGAAFLPGVKRAMGYATACDINLMRAAN